MAFCLLGMLKPAMRVFKALRHESAGGGKTSFIQDILAPSCTDNSAWLSYNTRIAHTLLTQTPNHSLNKSKAQCYDRRSAFKSYFSSRKYFP